MLSIRRILNRLKTIEKNTFNVPINQSPLVPDSTEKLEESYKRLGVDLVDKLESTKIRKCNPHIDEFEGQEGG